MSDITLAIHLVKRKTLDKERLLNERLTSEGFSEFIGKKSEDKDEIGVLLKKVMAVRDELDKVVAKIN